MTQKFRCNIWPFCIPLFKLCRNSAMLHYMQKKPARSWQYSGNSLPTFLDDLLVQYSKVKNPCCLLLWFLTLEDWIYRLSRNVGKELQLLAVQKPMGAQFSSVSRRKSEMSYVTFIIDWGKLFYLLTCLPWSNCVPRMVVQNVLVFFGILTRISSGYSSSSTL